MHKSATKCNETIGKWCKNKHEASKIIDTFETYHSPHGRTRSELKAFFEKAKKFAPTIVSIISPSAAYVASFMPTSSTPAMADSTPPSTAGADFAMPSSTMEQNAEVA
jgi:hypothetical protein